MRKRTGLCARTPDYPSKCLFSWGWILSRQILSVLGQSATVQTPELARSQSSDQLSILGHLRHIDFCPLDGIWIPPWEIHRLSLCLWQREIFKDGIRIHNCLFTQDKRIICIQILFSGYNLILGKAFGCSEKLLSQSDSINCFGMWTKGFPVFRLFPIRFWQ